MLITAPPAGWLRRPCLPIACLVISLGLFGCHEVRPAATTHVDRPLLAYVGTFSSPLKDVLPTQVDLPPGNGRGIHIFRVDRVSGAMTAAAVHEMGTSPSHLAVNPAGT